MTNMVQVYDIVESHSWGRQVVATVWDLETAESYCAARPNHFVETWTVPEDQAFSIAE